MFRYISPGGATRCTLVRDAVIQSRRFVTEMFFEEETDSRVLSVGRSGLAISSAYMYLRSAILLWYVVCPSVRPSVTM